MTVQFFRSSLLRQCGADGSKCTRVHQPPRGWMQYPSEEEISTRSSEMKKGECRTSRISIRTGGSVRLENLGMLGTPRLSQFSRKEHEKKCMYSIVKIPYQTVKVCVLYESFSGHWRTAESCISFLNGNSFRQGVEQTRRCSPSVREVSVRHPMRRLLLRGQQHSAENGLFSSQPERLRENDRGRER